MYHNLPAEKYNDLLFFEPFQEKKNEKIILWKSSDLNKY